MIYFVLKPTPCLKVWFSKLIICFDSFRKSKSDYFPHQLPVNNIDTSDIYFNWVCNYHNNHSNLRNWRKEEKIRQKPISDASCILLASKLHLSRNLATIVAELSDSDVIWQQKSMNTQLATRRRCSAIRQQATRSIIMICVLSRVLPNSATGSMNPALC